jgi:hypothetical protein
MTPGRLGKDMGNLKNDTPDLVEEITDPERHERWRLGILFAE